MTRLFKLIDLFGENITLNFNQEEKINTKFGGYLSLCIVALTIFCAWVIGKDIVIKSNPFNYQQQIAHKKILNNTINKTNFPLAFALIDMKGKPLFNTSAYINFNLVYLNYNYDDETKVAIPQVRPIQLSKCTYDDFPSLSHEEFNDAHLANGLCPQADFTSLYGYGPEDSFGFLSLIVKLCDFDVAENNCRPYEEIKEYISNNKVSFIFWALEPKIVITNYSQPVQNYVISKYKSLLDNLKIVDYAIDRNIVQTDAGILFESTEIVEYYKLRELNTDIAFFDANQKVLVYTNFLSSNLQTIYVRKYIKIPEILASTGGMFKIFSLIGYLINISFANIKKNLITFHCLFHIEDNNVSKKSEIITIFSKKNVNIKNVSNMINSLQPSNNLQLHISNSNFELTTVNNQLKNLIHKIKSRKPATIKLSTSDYRNLICKTNNFTSQNMHFYEKALRRIKDYFDIIFIIKKLIEVEIMKELLFTESQRKILENIKPVLTTDEIMSKNSKQNAFEEELTNLFYTQTKTSIDDQLIKVITSFQ